MKAVFDTSSILNFVRYYVPLDKTGELKEIFRSKYLSGEIRVIDKVISECGLTSKGLVMKELDFLKPNAHHVNTNAMLPDKKFFNLLDNQFFNHLYLNSLPEKLSKAELEKSKRDFLNGADAKLLLYSLHISSQNPIIITEETEHSNDRKIFRKIPSNCKHLNIDCCTLPELLNEKYKIGLKLI
jgi:hypothetical protein